MTQHIHLQDRFLNVHGIHMELLGLNQLCGGQYLLLRQHLNRPERSKVHRGFHAFFQPLLVADDLLLQNIQYKVKRGLAVIGGALRTEEHTVGLNGHFYGFVLIVIGHNDIYHRIVIKEFAQLFQALFSIFLKAVTNYGLFADVVDGHDGHSLLIVYGDWFPVLLFIFYQTRRCFARAIMQFY